MKIITAPEDTALGYGDTRVFIAGGISNCPDWQADFCDQFRGYSGDLTLINPRRDNFDLADPEASSIQIEWEYERLQAADIIVFWFPEETLCPITLFELGAALHTHKDLIVGCHPNYARRFDVQKQMELVRGKVVISDNLDDLVNRLKKHDLVEMVA